jgi:hypothetical protein
LVFCTAFANQNPGISKGAWHPEASFLWHPPALNLRGSTMSTILASRASCTSSHLGFDVCQAILHMSLQMENNIDIF